jgi:hypothetical protein
MAPRHPCLRHGPPLRGEPFRVAFGLVHLGPSPERDDRLLQSRAPAGPDEVRLEGAYGFHGHPPAKPCARLHRHAGPVCARSRHRLHHGRRSVEPSRPQRRRGAATSLRGARAGGPRGRGVQLRHPRMPGPDATFDYKPAPPELLARARRMQDACTARGVPLRAAALQFPLRHPAVSATVFGARSDAEVIEDLTDLDREITAELWDELDPSRAGGLRSLLHAQRWGRTRRFAIPPSTKSHMPVVEVAVGDAR